MSGEEWIGPDAPQPVEAQADELFVHGLLSSEADDDPDVMRRRIEAVMRAIDAAPRRRNRPLPWLLAAAAAAALLLWLTRTQPTDAPGAALAAAAAALQHAGDRSYHVEASLTGASDSVLVGDLDVRDATHHVLRAELHGVPLVVGRDGLAPWFAGDERLATHFRQESTRPGAFALGHHVLMLLPPEVLLPRLTQGFDLRSGATPTLAEHAGIALRHVVAHRATPDALPDRVEVWIATATGTVQRVLIHWSGSRANLALPGAPTGDADLAVRVDLRDAPSFPDDWFRAERHR